MIVRPLCPLAYAASMFAEAEQRTDYKVSHLSGEFPKLPLQHFRRGALAVVDRSFGLCIN